MGDKATIEAAFAAKKLEDLETEAEAAARNRAPSVVVTLTPPIIDQVLDALKVGTSIREIQATPVQIGPQGQKWKLSKAQVLAIENGRRAKYAELLSDLSEE